MENILFTKYEHRRMICIFVFLNYVYSINCLTISDTNLFCIKKLNVIYFNTS